MSDYSASGVAYVVFNGTFSLIAIILLIIAVSGESEFKDYHVNQEWSVLIQRRVNYKRRFSFAVW